MIEIKEAIKIGKEFVQEVYQESDDVILDSASRSAGGWSIKFRIPLNIKPINSLQNVLGINRRIFYKTVKIDQDGSIIGITSEDLPTNEPSEIQTEIV